MCVIQSLPHPDFGCVTRFAEWFCVRPSFLFSPSPISNLLSPSPLGRKTHLPRGRFLGQFKDELKGDVIDEFVAGGPKNYAYRTRSGQECCKVRGFTLDARGQAVLNFESVRNLVQKDIDEPLDRPRTLSVDNPHHILRNVTDKALHSVLQLKTYCMVQDKRVLDAGTGMTYPYGYLPS